MTREKTPLVGGIRGRTLLGTWGSCAWSSCWEPVGQSVENPISADSREAAPASDSQELDEHETRSGHGIVRHVWKGSQAGGRV